MADLRESLTAQDCKVIELGECRYATLVWQEVNRISTGAGTGIVSLVLGAIRTLRGRVGPDGCIFTTDLGDTYIPFLLSIFRFFDHLFQP